MSVDSKQRLDKRKTLLPDIGLSPSLLNRQSLLSMTSQRIATENDEKKLPILAKSVIKEEEEKEGPQSQSFIKNTNRARSKSPNRSTSPGNDEQGGMCKYDVRTLMESYNNFDYNHDGLIDTTEFESFILLLDNYKQYSVNLKALLEPYGLKSQRDFSFDEVLSVVHEIEKNISNEMNKYNPDKKRKFEANRLIEDYLKILHDYKRRMFNDKNYGEAKKVLEKMEEIKNKELERQKTYVVFKQKDEMKNMESAQKQSAKTFQSSWDDYFRRYEETSEDTLKKIRISHQKEVREFKQNVESEHNSKSFKGSNELYNLRKRQEYLARMNLFREAEEIMEIADKLESAERQKKNEELVKAIETKTETLKKQQMIFFNTVLKRMETEKNEFRKRRELDTAKLELVNKNIKNDLLRKHQAEEKKHMKNVKEHLSRAFYIETNPYSYSSVERSNKPPGTLGNKSETNFNSSQKTSSSWNKQTDDGKKRENSAPPLREKHSGTPESGLPTKEIGKSLKSIKDGGKGVQRGNNHMI